MSGKKGYLTWMNLIPIKRSAKKSSRAGATHESILQLAFYNAAQANIISIVSTGKILIANAAACKLLGYSKKELLTKSRNNIFDIKDAEFKKMLKQRTLQGHSVAIVNAIKKTGKQVSCEITSAVFSDENGVKRSITSIVDISKKILEQKVLDKEKEKIVADNIALANSIVADDIVMAQKKFDARAAENIKWIKHIAKTSYDVMWDLDLITGLVYIGESIKEVFGYKLKNNSVRFAALGKYFVSENNNAVNKNLQIALASDSRSWNDSFKIKRRDGSIASVNSRAVIVRDNNGKAIRLIGATQDTTRLQDLETMLEKIKTEKSDIFHLAAKLSYDGIWDWNLLTNEFFLGDGFKELFGDAFVNDRNESFSWTNFLHPDDKEAVEKGFEEALASTATTWEHAYRFVRADGTIADVFGRASIIRDAAGKACRMVGVIHDQSRQKELERKLQLEIASAGKLISEYDESFRLMFNSSSDILYDIDLATDEILLSDGYQKEFGYPVTPHMKTADVWGRHLHPEDKEGVFQDYNRMLASKETGWKYSYRFLRADGSVANILSSRIILRSINGIAYRMIGSMQDISKQTVLEEKLAQEIKLKEKQISDAMQDAKEAILSDLGKELHDNVNQLLGASRLYLEMAKQGGPNSEMHLSRSSEYTLNAIEEIRKLTKGMATESIKNLGLSDAIEILASDTMQVNAVKINCTLDIFIEPRVNDKFKLNVFRIVQEQLNNILKHARAKKVVISFSQSKNAIVLVISDDGVGFDTTIKSKGIGLDNIKSRAGLFDGKASFVSEPGKGCILTVTFAVTDKLLKDNM
jgi:PAS domain S-box-containing protein